MKEYLVTMDNADWDNIFIVSAKNSEEAIRYVFDKYFKYQNKNLREENKRMGYNGNHIFTKSDFIAKSIYSLHSKEGKIIHIN